MFVQVFLRSDVLLQRSCESSSPHLGSSEKNFRTSLSSHLGTRAPSASGSTSSRSRKVRKKMEYGRLLCPVRARLFFTFLPAYLGCWRIGESLCEKKLRCQSGFRETGVVPHDGITLAHADRLHGSETPSPPPRRRPQASARQLPATPGRICRYSSPHTPASTPL